MNQTDLSTDTMTRPTARDPDPLDSVYNGPHPIDLESDSRGRNDESKSIHNRADRHHQRQSRNATHNHTVPSSQTAVLTTKDSNDFSMCTLSPSSMPTSISSIAVTAYRSTVHHQSSVTISIYQLLPQASLCNLNTISAMF